ncbi:MAG TPA: hypothetical protein VLJ37_00770 [bacterium]|nr:hypothetical protein [bacterium]
MAQSPAFKAGVFSNDATHWATDWLTRQGVRKAQIDGALPDQIGENPGCAGVAQANGVLETEEVFAVAFSPVYLGKFNAAARGQRTSPFAKIDPGFDLSWLQLGGGQGGFDVEVNTKLGWIDKLAGPADRDGSLENLAEAIRRKNAGYIYSTRAYELADRALRTTEFGLLPLEDQIALVDDFVIHQTYQTFQEDEQREAFRSNMMRAVIEHHHGVTTNQAVSLFVQIRGREYELKGQDQKAAELYDLASKMDPNNRTALAKLGVLEARRGRRSGRTDVADRGFERLKAAYEAGIRDDDVLTALAEEHAQRGDFRAAVDFAMERRGREHKRDATSEEIAWDLKICEWARKDNNLLLIDDLMRARSGGTAYIKDAERQQVILSLNDPQAWIAAAEAAWKRGDYEAAYASFTTGSGRCWNEYRVNANGGLSKVSRANPDRQLWATFRGRIDELQKDRASLPATLQTRYDALVVLSETQPITGDFSETEARLALYEEAMVSLEMLEVLEKQDPAKTDLTAAFKPVLKSVYLGGADATSVTAALDKLEADLLKDPDVPAMWVKSQIQTARLRIQKGPFSETDAAAVVQDLAGGLNQALGAGIRRADVRDEIAQARVKIASGALHGDRKMYEEGVAALEELQRYKSLEVRKEAVFQKALSYYYSNTRFIFESDLTGKTDHVFSDGEARPKDVEELAILQTIKRLEKENPELADYGKTLLANLRSSATRKGYRIDTQGYTSFLMYDPAKDGPMVDGYTEGRIAGSGVRNTNDALERIYGNEEMMEAFFSEVDGTREKESLKDNPAYQKRLDLENGLQALPSYSVFLKAFEMARTKGGEGLTADDLQGGRDFLLERGRVLKTYLEERRDWVGEGMGSEPAAMAYHDNEMEIEALSRDMAWLESAEIPYVEEGVCTPDTAVFLERMEAVSAKFAVYEDSHVRHLLEHEMNTVDNLPSDKNNRFADLQAVRDEFSNLQPLQGPYGDEPADPETMRLLIKSIDGRIKAARGLAQKVDDVAFARAVDMRLLNLASMESTSDTAGSIAYNWITVGGLLDPADGDWKENHGYDRMKAQYNEVKRLWALGDRAGARKLYMALGSARLNDDLADDYKWSGRLNTLVTVEAVILAAMTAGAASEFVAPLAEAAFSEGVAANVVTFTNAVVFSASNGIYHGLLTDGLSGAWKGVKHIGSLSFVEEAVITFGMFKFLGMADGLFEATLGKYLGETGRAVGSFMTEGAAFQAWDFLQTNYQMIKNGHWDPLKAAKHAFNVTSLDSGFGGGFLFLIALKAGGTLSAPLARPMNEAARNLAYKTLGIDVMERELQVGLERNLKAMDEYFSKGRGNLNDLLKQQEDLLLKQKESLEKLPEEVRNNDLLSVNGKMLENVRQFRDAYEKSVLEKIRQSGGSAFGVKVIKGGVLQYDAGKGIEFATALAQDPSVLRVRVAKNGLVVADFIDPLGRPARVRFVPIKATPERLNAMRALLPEPAGDAWAEDTAVTDLAAKRQ